MKIAPINYNINDDTSILLSNDNKIISSTKK